MYSKALAICGLIGIGVAGRLIPHVPNMTPLTAITLAGSRYVGRTWAIAIPIAAMLVSDVVIGWYDWRILASVYLSVALMGLLSFSVRKRIGMLTSGVVVIGSSLVFFLITNFAVWLFSPWFDKSFSGLMYAYELGIPFFRSMMIGDLIYTPLLFGAIELALLLSVLPHPRRAAA